MAFFSVVITAFSCREQTVKLIGTFRFARR
jgi:hypothetical protein